MIATVDESPADAGPDARALRDAGTLASLPDAATDSLETGDAEGATLTRLRQGDAAAFEELVRDQMGKLLAVARRLLRSEQDAQDAVQEAFLSAFRALPGFAGQSRLSTWLHRIVVNVALMKLRTRRRRPEESIEGLLPRFLEDGHHAVQYSEWRLRADERLLRGEVATHVRQAIDRLPDSYRTVLLLRDIEQLDTEETARLLGVTPNAVKIRLHRARQALRTRLDPAFAASHHSAGATAAGPQ